MNRVSTTLPPSARRHRSALATGLILGLTAGALTATAARAAEPPAPDITAPIAEVALHPETPSGRNGWYTGPVTATITGEDDTGGPVTLEYLVDRGPLQPYTAPVTLTDDGRHVVVPRATDAAGNESEEIPVDVWIDTTDPSVSAARTGRYLVAITASDVMSGVASIEYRYLVQAAGRSQHTAWRTYLGPVPAGPGRVIAVEYRSTDVAGNRSETRTVG